MKVAFCRIGLMSALALTAAALLVSPCKAQSEISPDHFDGTDAWAAAAQTPAHAKLVSSAAKATPARQSQEALLVNIPFGFTAGRMVLPAGEYRVQKSAHDSQALLIQRTDQSAATLVSSSAAQANAPQTQSQLVFHRYGNRYFLSNVWTAGSSRGRELPKSAKEKKQALVAGNETPNQVTIVAELLTPNP